MRNLLAEPRTDAAHRRDFLDRALPDPFDRAEGLQQGLLARLGDAGNLVEQTFADAFLEQKAVEAVGEAMRFIADPLEQLERSAIFRQAQREGTAGPINLLEFLGQSDDRLIVESEALQFFAGAGELPLAAIDNDQIG